MTLYSFASLYNLTEISFFGGQSQREKTRTIADHHANLAKTVEGSIVQHLQKLKAEIKAHIKNIQMDTGKLAAVGDLLFFDGFTSSDACFSGF